MSRRTDGDTECDMERESENMSTPAPCLAENLRPHTGSLARALCCCLTCERLENLPTTAIVSLVKILGSHPSDPGSSPGWRNDNIVAYITADLCTYLSMCL